MDVLRPKIYIDFFIKKWYNIDTIKNEREDNKVVGIFKYEGGLSFKAISANKYTAKKAIYDKHASDFDKSLSDWYIDTGRDPVEVWWDRVGHNVYVILEVEYW